MKINIQSATVDCVFFNLSQSTRTHFKAQVMSNMRLEFTSECLFLEHVTNFRVSKNNNNNNVDYSRSSPCDHSRKRPALASYHHLCEIPFEL